MSEFDEIDPAHWQQLLRTVEREECEHVAEQLVEQYMDRNKNPSGVPVKWNGKVSNPYLEDFKEEPYAFVQVGRIRDPEVKVDSNFDLSGFDKTGQRLWKLSEEGSTMSTGFQGSLDLHAIGQQMNRHCKEPTICQKITKYSSDKKRVFNTFVFKRVTKLGSNDPEYRKKRRTNGGAKEFGTTVKFLNFDEPLPPAKELDKITKEIVAEVRAKEAEKKRKAVVNPYEKKSEVGVSAGEKDDLDGAIAIDSTTEASHEGKTAEPKTSEDDSKSDKSSNNDMFEDCVESNQPEAAAKAKDNKEEKNETTKSCEPTETTESNSTNKECEARSGTTTETEEAGAIKIAIPYKARTTKKWQDIGRLDPKVRHLLTPEKERYIQQVVTGYFSKKNTDKTRSGQSNCEG